MGLHSSIPMTERFDNLPGKAPMPFSAFCVTFELTNREHLILADGLQLDHHGVDPEAAFRLLQ